MYAPFLLVISQEKCTYTHTQVGQRWQKALLDLGQGWVAIVRFSPLFWAFHRPILMTHVGSAWAVLDWGWEGVGGTYLTGNLGPCRIGQKCGPASSVI